MRRASLGIPPASMNASQEGQFVLGALRELSLASFENDAAAIASEFTITNHTDTRDLDISTATLTDLKNFVATLVLDMARGGSKKG